METTQYKYNCKQCNFSCQFNSAWKKHIATELHKTGKRKQRSDIKDPYKCKNCDYETKNIATFKKHVLNAHSNKEVRQKEFKYYCNVCDYGTISKDTFANHNETNRHKTMIIRNTKI